MPRVVLILGAAGAVMAWWQNNPVLRVASLLLGFTYLAYIPFAVVNRYAVPVFPALYLLAVFAIVFVLSGMAAWSRRIEAYSR